MTWWPDLRRPGSEIFTCAEKMHEQVCPEFTPGVQTPGVPPGVQTPPPPARRGLKVGSVPAFLDRMELMAQIRRTGFLELIHTFKTHGNVLNSSNFEYPSAKFAPTGCRSYPNHISHHYEQ